MSNAATEWIRLGYGAMSRLTSPPALSPGIADDFVLDDRRSGGANFGTVDASGWAEFVSSIWDVSSGHVQFEMREIVATRDQRLAAYIEVLTYGGGETSESIMCVSLDPGLQMLERLVIFDLEDLGGAIAELDRLYAQVAD